MNRALLVLLTLPLLAAGQDTDVYSLLDEGKDSSLRELGVDELYEAIKKGRAYKKVEAFKNKRTLKDANGRETDLYLIVPENPTGVIFVLHGLGGDGRQLKDRLYNKFAKREGLIIAAPTAQKEPEGAKNEDNFDKFMGNRMPHWWSYHDGNFVLSALSLLKKEFPIDENRVYLSGYSMGGFGTWNIGLRHPDRFAALVPFAGGLSRGEYLKKEDKTLRPLMFNAHHTPLYFVHGSRDTTVPCKLDRKSRDQLKELGYDHTYVEVEGARHIMDVSEGGKLMKPIQAWLKEKKRNAHPKTVKFHSLSDRMPQAFWVRIDEFSGKQATVTADIKEGNLIEVTSEGVKSLTLFIDEEHIDADKPVTVRVNEKEVFQGRVERSVDTVLESWKAREDRDLIYRAKVRLELD